MEFILNGEKRTFEGDTDLTLSYYLRERAGITSCKVGCSGQGACGGCTVIMDGKATLSCTTSMKQVQGKTVITPDGLEEKIQDIFARAFVLKGGVQCGFCTPGMVMAARALLLSNPDPTRGQIKKALQRNLCRCTGYKKIIDSILYAARVLRGEETLPEENATGKIGSRLARHQAYQAVLGKRPFVGDLKEDGMLFAALRFSDHPRARLLRIDAAAAEKTPGVIRIFTAADIPGRRLIGLIIEDWPVMVAVGEETRYLGDVIAGVVAEADEIARRAARKIRVKYEILAPVTTVDEALKPDAPLIHQSGNVLSLTSLKRGDPNQAIANAAYLAKGSYYTQRVEHAYMETECALARPCRAAGEAGIHVFSQGQGAYEDRRQIAMILGLPEKRVRVVQVATGGAFGGKEDLSVQGHAALYAYLLKKPVRVSLTREESLIMHPKRHPMRLDYAVACDKNGKLTGMIAEIVGDTGAYASVGMKVLERAAGHAAGAYAVPNVLVRSRAVYTNNIPCGAMRGFGVPQATFAMESCVDDLCRQGGFDRWQFRYDNALADGKETVTGQILHGGVGLRETLMAVKDVFYQAPYAGIACAIKNTGIGNGVPDIGRAKIVVESGSKLIIYHGWTEMGQGVHTMAIQTVCERTGLDPSIIEVRVDTASETVCGMTTASRGTSLVGNSLIVATERLIADLRNCSLKDLAGKEYTGEWIYNRTSKIGEVKPDVGHETHYSYGYATQVVTLDEKGKIDKIYAAHDVGRIMNPTLFEGQIEGAVHMGLGYALTEDFPMKDGRPVSLKLGKCGVLRAPQMPEVIVIGVEAGDPHGPFGAKGVGEIGMAPTAASVANALHAFDGMRRYSLPLKRNPK
ncbi:MAG: selenium-dependent xanthine dehydrogenase [Acidobacteriia bacterium]|nr:selenium-dependent xanthine dehydrogenase [Terriglobia bacterium]